MIKLKKRYFFLVGLGLLIYSLFDNSEPIVIFESVTEISLQEYDVEVSSEVITSGPFGSDSYTKYYLSFSKSQFENLISDIKNQKVYSKSDWTKTISNHSNDHPTWIEFDDEYIFLVSKVYKDQNCYNDIRISKRYQKIIIKCACPW